jgi:tRNA(Ile)-lysidine synthase
MPEGRWHLRPLLSLSKMSIRAALCAAGGVWREDATNATGVYFRNRIRADVLPAWAQAAGRDAVAGAARSRDLLEEDDAALEAWLDELRPLRRGVLALAPLAKRPQALMRRALHRWLLAVRPDTDLSRQGFDQLLAKLRDGRDTRFSLGREGFAVIRGGQLRYERA